MTTSEEHGNHVDSVRLDLHEASVDVWLARDRSACMAQAIAQHRDPGRGGVDETTHCRTKVSEDKGMSHFPLFNFLLKSKS